MKALREAKAFVSLIGTPLCRAEELLAALVEAVEAAPVGVVEIYDTPEQWTYVIVPNHLNAGQRVRVLAVGEDA